MKTEKDIRRQAEMLAREGKKVEPGIESVYWFPSASEIRLVEIETNTVKCLSGMLEPFYFNAAPDVGVTVPFGVATIRRDEFGLVKLPAGWGKWADAVPLELEG